jgi:ABC-type nickel/cobalt efflux system permease component RcnA
MGALISALWLLFFAYSAYRESKQDGSWSWRHFFTLIGLVAVLLFCFIIPVVSSKTLEAHPGLLMTVLFGGIVLFVTGIIILARKWGREVTLQMERRVAAHVARVPEKS